MERSRPAAPQPVAVDSGVEGKHEEPEHDLVLSGQLTNPNDNAERYNVGAEYTWNNLLSLRAGYRFGVDEATLPSVGAGLLVPGIGPGLRIDYGFTNLERLGSVHRVGINLRLD